VKYTRESRRGSDPGSFAILLGHVLFRLRLDFLPVKAKRMVSTATTSSYMDYVSDLLVAIAILPVDFIKGNFGSRASVAVTSPGVCIESTHLYMV
jgi:hypothetical protein